SARVPYTTLFRSGLGDRAGHLLALGGELEVFGVARAELVRADPQPVAAGLAGHGHQVLAGGERGDQLVDGGARQLQLAHDVGGGERPVPVEEELEDVQSPGHGWYEASHGRS